MNLNLFLPAGAAAVLALALTSTSAQVPPQQTPEHITQAPSETAPLADEKLDQFAAAYVAIESIHAEAETALAATADPIEENQVKQQAEAAMIDAVEQSGLALEEFNEIAALAQLSPELNAELARRVEQHRTI